MKFIALLSLSLMLSTVGFADLTIQYENLTADIIYPANGQIYYEVCGKNPAVRGCSQKGENAQALALKVAFHTDQATYTTRLNLLTYAGDNYSPPSEGEKLAKARENVERNLAEGILSDVEKQGAIERLEKLKTVSLRLEFIRDRFFQFLISSEQSETIEQVYRVADVNWLKLAFNPLWVDTDNGRLWFVRSIKTDWGKSHTIDCVGAWQLPKKDLITLDTMERLSNSEIGKVLGDKWRFWVNEFNSEKFIVVRTPGQMYYSPGQYSYPHNLKYREPSRIAVGDAQSAQAYMEKNNAPSAYWYATYSSGGREPATALGAVPRLIGEGTKRTVDLQTLNAETDLAASVCVGPLPKRVE